MLITSRNINIKQVQILLNSVFFSVETLMSYEKTCTTFLSLKYTNKTII